MNRQYRAQENPNYFQAERRRQEVRREALEYQFQNVLKGDPTDQLNWLLAELSGPMLAFQYLPDHAPLADSKLNPELNPDDLAQLWLTDGGPGGSRLVISAGNPEVLETRWPLSFSPSPARRSTNTPGSEPRSTAGRTQGPRQDRLPVDAAVDPLRQ